MTDTTASRTTTVRTQATTRWVVTVDGSYETGEALLWALRLQRSLGGELVAVRVWHPGIGEFDERRHRAARQRVRAQLASWCHDAVGTEVAVHYEVVDGDVPAAFEAVLTHRADQLLVLGIDPPTLAAPSTGGGITRRVAHETRHPVAFVPTSGAARVIRRIVVGVDGSPSSLAAVRWLAPVADALGAEVHVVTVFEPLVEWVPAGSAGSVWRRLARRLDGDWTVALRDRGVPCRPHVLEGTDPVEVLGAFALQHHADLVVVGASTSSGRFHLRRGVAAIRLTHDTGLAVVMAPASHP